MPMNLRYLFYLSSLLVLIAGSVSFGNEPSQDPETIVEISLSEFRPGQKKPVLPPDYGKRVAKFLGSHRDDLRSCIEQTSLSAHEFSVAILIASSGTARVEADSKAAVEGVQNQVERCITRLLSSWLYPSHPLRKDVRVHLPLNLKRSVL